jgi:GNAT superfamily N-acetyltransferase
MENEFYDIRNAKTEDALDISELSMQLGYSSSEYEMKERLDSILNSDDQTVFVAFQTDGKVIAWIHILKCPRVESDCFAEIGGFIVAKEFRGKGIGRRLLKTVEDWAEQKKLHRLRVRSKIEREDAIKFYSKCGFSVLKTQAVFDKITGGNKA